MKKSNLNLATIIILLLILSSIIIVTITATSVITTQNELTEYDIDQYLQDTLNKISSYIEVQNVYGKFNEEKPYSLTQIGIMISPMFHKSIDMTDWIVQLKTKNSINIYTIHNSSETLKDNTIFNHDIWNSISTNQYGLISIIDKDSSIKNYSVFNDPGDLSFLIFRIASNEISKGDVVTIIISSGKNIQKSVTFSIPIPTNNVVTLW